MSKLSTIRDFVRYAITQFGKHPVTLGHGTASLWDEALSLVFGALHLPPDGDQRLLDSNVNLLERRKILGLVSRRIGERLPVPYLTKLIWFCGLPFYVDERVLIPRSPIGEFIKKELSEYLFDKDSPWRVLDLCCGSGCLGIAVAAHIQNVSVILSDVDSDVCEVAKKNVSFHQFDEQIQVMQSNLFEQLIPEKFDLIIANPPYADEDAMRNLPPEYLWEPKKALAAGPDGLSVIRPILETALDWLNERGILILEAGESWRALERLLIGNGIESIRWLSFELGGYGVVMLSKNDLAQTYRKRAM